MSSPQTKNDANAPADDPQTVADVANVVAPNLLIGAVQAKDIVATKDVDPERLLGRPIGYSQDIADKIAEAFAAGESLNAIGEKDGFPSTRTISRWRMRFPEFEAQMMAAIRASIDMLHDRTVGIGHETITVTHESELPIARFKAQELERKANVFLNVAAARTDAYMKMAAKKPGDDAKVIEGTCADIAIPDDAGFQKAINADTALQNFMAATGIKSKAREGG